MNCLNIACGDSYVESWFNVDFAPHSPSVQRANLLGRLPFSDASMDIVYTSHFIEHIPRHHVLPFLKECFRVLKHSGYLRIVTPDFEILCQEYLKHREAADHRKADFVVMEILDQCVRQEAGGELGQLFRSLQDGDDSDMEQFVADMTGYQAKSANSQGMKTRLQQALRNPAKAFSWLTGVYCRVVTFLLPPAFRVQNVSHTAIGERHQWLYDFHTLGEMLSHAGFCDVRKMAHDQTGIPKFPLERLDVTTNGLPRKGKESMFVEAQRPPA